MKKLLEEYTDSELFQMLPKGGATAEKAFAELYARLSPRVYAYCRRFLGEREEAKDVFQETFTKFFQSSSQTREMTNVPAFILRIARNLCMNRKRSSHSDLSFEEYMVVKEDHSNEQEELLGLIHKALEQLPDDYAEMFILREYDGLSYSEIAEVTGENIGTVKIRLYRAKQKIKEILAPYLNEIEKYNW